MDAIGFRLSETGTDWVFYHKLLVPATTTPYFTMEPPPPPPLSSHASPSHARSASAVFSSSSSRANKDGGASGASVGSGKLSSWSIRKENLKLIEQHQKEERELKEGRDPAFLDPDLHVGPTALVPKIIRQNIDAVTPNPNIMKAWIDFAADDLGKDVWDLATATIAKLPERLPVNHHYGAVVSGVGLHHEKGVRPTMEVQMKGFFLFRFFKLFVFVSS